MTRKTTRCTATVASAVAVVAAGVVAPPAAQAAELKAKLVKTVELYEFEPPSPDSSGIAYDSSRRQFIIADSEVDEMAIYRAANLFTVSEQGDALVDTGDTTTFSKEPTGVAYNVDSDTLLVSDDDKDRVFELTRGSNGIFGSAGSTMGTMLATTGGNTDPEDVAYDSKEDRVYVIDGVASAVYRYSTSGSLEASFDVSPFAPGSVMDPEGITYDTASDHLLIVDSKTKAVYETTTSGQLVNRIDISSAGIRKEAGIAVAPASDGSGARHLFIVQRGIDNDGDPDENDGRLFELAVGDGGQEPNASPVVSAGPDVSGAVSAAVGLAGTATDDGKPNGTLTTQWTAQSGPGTVAFADASAPSTTATFSAPGEYVLQLSGSDGLITDLDTVTVTITAANTAPVVNAGPDTRVPLGEAAVLSGTVTDDGLPSGSLTYAWAKTAGPGTVRFGSRNATSTTATFSVAGTYRLRLRASDGSLTGQDVVQVVVTDSNIAPRVNLGADRTVKVRTRTRFSASVTDDGLPMPPGAVTVRWRKASGPGSVTFSAPRRTTTGVTFSTVGTYVLRLVASDSALSGRDTITVRVVR